MEEAAADSEGALADGGVLEPGAEVSAGEAAHAAAVALRAEPAAARGGGPGQAQAARGGGPGQAQAARVERPQTGAPALYQPCPAICTRRSRLRTLDRMQCTALNAFPMSC